MEREEKPTAKLPFSLSLKPQKKPSAAAADDDDGEDRRVFVTEFDSSQAQTEEKPMAKLPFSLSLKPQKKPSAAVGAAAADGEDRRVFVTEFDSSQAPTNNADNRPIIPPKANEWRPNKKMKNLDLPLQSEGEHPSLQFEVVPALSTDPISSDSMSYGLNLRKPESNPNPNPNPSVVVSSNRVDPTLVKLREDLSSLQEEAGPDDFGDIPVEAFSRALLAGYGWTEGRGVGRNAPEDVKVYEYKKRTAKEGLGFTGEIPQLPGKANQDDGRKKVGVENDKRGLGGGLAGYNGKEKGFYVGKDVRIVGGKEMGMKGRIVEVKRDSEVAVLRLLNSDMEVKADIRDLADLGSKEEERCLRKLKELERREMSNGFDKRSSRDNREKDKGATISRQGSGGDEGRDRKKKESKRKREENKKNESDKFSWLTSHIRVRIISKEIKGGRLYLKKGEVVDVVGPTSCDVAIDESKELIQGVDQEQVETAIPKRGGRVLVLSGKHKGVYGSLVERDLEKETGVVQDADTHDMFKVRLEQIAEYTGDPSYLGY